MTASLDLQLKVSEWRAKAREGTLTTEEMREALQFLRQDRLAMPQGKAKKPKTVINGDDLLAEFL